MKTLKTLFTLSAIIALSTVTAQAKTETIDLSTLDLGLKGVVTVTAENVEDCNTEKCDAALEARLSTTAMKAEIEKCETGTCDLRVDNVPECGKCEVKVTIE